MSNDDPVIRLLTEIRDNQREDIALRRQAIEESRAALEINRQFQAAAMRRVRRFMVVWVVGLVIALPILAGAVWLILNAGTIANGLVKPATISRPVQIDGSVQVVRIGGRDSSLRKGSSAGSANRPQVNCVPICTITDNSHPGRRTWCPTPAAGVERHPLKTICRMWDRLPV